MKPSKLLGGCIGMAALGYALVASAFTCAGPAASCVAVEPGRVDTLTIGSSLLPQPMRVNVALPAGYFADGDTARYPVLYMLNGHGGHSNSWGGLVPLDSIASERGMIIVTPSGMNSWYFDSPVRPDMQMETFITSELIPYIDTTYRTRADRTGRAITGLSMGGHGALWLAIRHQDLFGAAGSTSGGVDFTYWPEKWNIKDYLGPRDADPDAWSSRTVMSQVQNLEPGSLTLIFDCGTEDFFYDVNCRLDSALNARHIPHTYITSPGMHNGDYWGRSIYPQIELFDEYFDTPRK